MTGSGIWIVSDGQWFGLLPSAFFGLGLVVSLILLLPGSSFLELDANGFVIRNVFRDSRLSWADIDGFETRRLGMRKFVTLNFARGYSASSRVRALAKGMSGAEGALPDTYGMSAEDLANLMNQHLRTYRQAPTNQGAT
jgi:hypothetical protein